ncbi:MAG: GNAT family N-acetyltransferase [Actinomycetaceae bacterium]|nr:GNAT family N-acetyltransferase [Actinomycetaceae bacterium]
MFADTLTNEQLSLTPPTAADAAEIFSICQDETIQNWTTVPSPYTFNDAETFIEKARTDWDDGTACTWLIRKLCSDDCEPSPILGCIFISRDDVVGEIGYWTRAEYRNQGIITEAVNIVVDYAFNVLKLQSILWRSVVQEGKNNWASYKPVWKAGFKLGGVIPKMSSYRGKATDFMVATLSADDPRTPVTAWRGPDDTHPAFPDPRDPEALVRQFHETYGMPIAADTPNVDTDRIHLRLNLIAEEFTELIGAAYGAKAREILENAWKEAGDHDDHARDTVEVADALGDLIYVIYGAALEFGLPMENVLAVIQASNLSKLGADGKPIYREDGKVMKGPNYFPPDIKKVLGL